MLSNKLIINQNFDKYWKSDKGNVGNYNGLLSVKFDNICEGGVKLTYFPTMFFHKKTAPLIPYSPLPHPIKPELMELLATRLTVKGL